MLLKIQDNKIVAETVAIFDFLASHYAGSFSYAPVSWDSTVQCSIRRSHLQISWLFDMEYLYCTRFVYRNFFCSSHFRHKGGRIASC